MQIDSFQVERFLTRKYVPTFFQSEKTRYLSPNFIKKKLPFRRRKKTTGRALNLAKHIIIIFVQVRVPGFVLNRRTSVSVIVFILTTENLLDRYQQNMHVFVEFNKNCANFARN